jgi:hypothetical protein
MEFVNQFKEFLPRLLVSLAVPFYLGLQFRMAAKVEKKTYKINICTMDMLGLLFSVVIPVFVIISSVGIYKYGTQYPELMNIVFRYGLMFLFMGMWWQLFGIMAVKAYRDWTNEVEVKKGRYLLFYAIASVFVSLTAFIGGEWFLKWMSLIFLAIAAPIILLPIKWVCVGFLIAAMVAFLVQTLGFIYVSSLA